MEKSINLLLVFLEKKILMVILSEYKKLHLKLPFKDDHLFYIEEYQDPLHNNLLDLILYDL